jgi:SAM-dependent methyltransferase
VADAGNRRSPHTALIEATKWFVPGDRDRRHDAALEVLARWEVRSVLEIGSGAGDFYARMRSRLPTVSSYTGCDLSARMVSIARRRHPGADFRHADILGGDHLLEDDQLGGHSGGGRPLGDAVVAIGVFALLVDEPGAHWLLMRRLIRRMWDLARIGVVFDFYDFFTEEDARHPRRYFAQELGRTDDTPIYCVRPIRVRRFAAKLGPVALTRIRNVDGRVWRCVVKRADQNRAEHQQRPER